MNLLKDLWGHLKEWNEWKMKDWIKAGIVVIVVLVVLKVIIVLRTIRTMIATIPAFIQSFIFHSFHSFKCPHKSFNKFMFPS